MTTAKPLQPACARLRYRKCIDLSWWDEFIEGASLLLGERGLTKQWHGIALHVQSEVLKYFIFARLFVCLLLILIIIQNHEWFY